MNTIVAKPIHLPKGGAAQRGQLLATQHMRLMILMLLFAAGMGVIVLRLAMLGVLSLGGGGSPTAGHVARGDIVDRNGQPLARTIDAWTIAVHPRQVLGDKMEIAGKLADLMPEIGDRAWFYARLTKDANFAYLNRRASPALVEAVNAIGDPGIVYDAEPQRLYPQSMLAAHVLGYIGSIGDDPRVIGRLGMERVLEDKLSSAATAGTPAQLSIDTRVQAAVESELSRAMTTFAARGAAGLVLDVRTGEVIAMSSLPTFNPNRVGMSGSEEFRNNTTQSVYELGSTFKPLTMAAAIDSGVVADMTRRFDATAPLQVGRFTIHDERGDPKRWLNIPETLIYSSNVATARVADLLGPDRMKGMFHQLAFDTKPDIELKEKGRPLLPSYWARTTTMTTAYGHGIAITPLQLAGAYAALVNGGVWRPATLMKVAPGHAAEGRRVFSEATSARMRQLLRLVVLYGTGRKGDAPGYRVGGKTGTGEIASGGGYDRSRNVATFAAVFPMDAPRYVVLVMLDSPKATAETFGWKTAAWNAAPTVGRIIARTGAMLGVTPDAGRDIDLADLTPSLGLVIADRGQPGGDTE